MDYQFDFDELDIDFDRNETQKANLVNAIETIDVDEPGMRERMGQAVLRLVRPRAGYALSEYNDRFDFAMALLRGGAELEPGEQGWSKLFATLIRMNDTVDGEDNRGPVGIPRAAEIPFPFAAIHYRGTDVQALAKLLQTFLSNGLDPNLVSYKGQALLHHVCLSYWRTDALEVLLHAGADTNHRCHEGLTADEHLVNAKSSSEADKQPRLQMIQAWRNQRAVEQVISRARSPNAP